jgi:predicted lipoprotein with Yx(FWY)xxD motif
LAALARNPVIGHLAKRAGAAHRAGREAKTMTGKSTIRRMPMPAKLAAGVGGAVGVALLAAACSSGGSSSAASTPASAPASSGGAAAAPAASGSAGSGGTVIATASSSGNTFLTDGGRAVYLWVKDTGDKSACSGACAGAWPPVTASGTVTAAGSAKASDLGTITRSDGTKQVTYDGHPLYFFTGDSGSGMATGQGSDSFGAKWWLVTPSGSDVTSSVTSFTAAAGSASGGSGATPASTQAPASGSSNAGGGWS